MPLAVCATPIGNLEDVTLRLLAELRAAASCSARTRGTRAACSSGTASRRGSCRITSTTRQPARQRSCRGSRRESASRSSRTPGMPGICDPGRADRAAAALAADVPVTRAARVLRGGDGARRVSGSSGRVSIPRLPAARRDGARRLWSELRGWPLPVVAFESPQRLPATLRSLAGADTGREAAVCRELTKRFEEVVRGTAFELAERFPEPPKGEITLVLGPGCELADVARTTRLGAVSGARRCRRTASDARRRSSRG